MEVDDNEEDRASMVSSHSRSISISAASTKGKAKAKSEPEEELAKPRPAKRQKTRTTKTQKAEEDKMNVDSPLSTPFHLSPHKSPGRKSATTPPSPTKSKSKPKSTAPATPKPKSTPLQKSPLSASYTLGSIDSRPPLPQGSESPTSKIRVEVRRVRKGLSPEGSVGSLKRTSVNVKSISRSRGGNKPKALGEIIDTSVDGEVDWT